MPAFTPHFTISNSITTALTMIERARGCLEAATLSARRGHQGGTLVPRCWSGGLQPRAAVILRSAIADWLDQRKWLICECFMDRAIATEPPLVAIPKQCRCKLWHPPSARKCAR
jgi:hypothetical protein